MQVFFSRGDYRAYVQILARQAERYRLRVWAYCLMPNHVHLVAVPADQESLARSFGEAHRLYAIRINRRNGWQGHLWQERFFSCPMDNRHALEAIRYVLLNPVRAGLVESAEEWRYSSARAHRTGRPDPLVDPRPAAHLVSDWASFLEPGKDSPEALALRRRTGRPLGSPAFVERLEELTGRLLRRRRPGPRPGTN